MFSCKACKLSKNNFFTEHLCMTASNLSTLQGIIWDTDYVELQHFRIYEMIHQFMCFMYSKSSLFGNWWNSRSRCWYIQQFNKC